MTPKRVRRTKVGWYVGDGTLRVIERYAKQIGDTPGRALDRIVEEWQRLREEKEGE